MSKLFDAVSSIPRGVETIREWLGEGGIPVDPATAQRRANICLECPKNVPPNIVTQSVALAIRRHLEVKNKLGMRVDGEKRLGKCDVCQCMLRLKIHVPIGIVRRQMPPGEFDAYPAPCWQTEEKENA